MRLLSRLDKDNNVIEVVCIDDDHNSSDQKNPMDYSCILEEDAISLCKEIYGVDTSWKIIPTNSINKNQVSIGYKYIESTGTFLAPPPNRTIPPKPFNSWVYNFDVGAWVSPLGSPMGVQGCILPSLTDEQISKGCYYRWDEDAYQADNTTGWVLETPEAPAE